MSISYDGSTLIWDGEVRITNFTDPETGVVTLVLTPSGGVGTLPALVAGTPGLPPVLTFVQHHVASGTTPPPATTTVTTPGGPGVASQVQVDFYTNDGAAGTPGTNSTLLGASDLETTPGAGTDGYVFTYDYGNNKVKLAAIKQGSTYVPGSYTATSGNTPVRTLAQVTVPSVTYNWRPLVFGYTFVTGTSSTTVDLVARLGDPNTGTVMGRCPGINGNDRPILIPSMGTLLPGSVTGAQTIYLNAEQQNSGVTDSWSTNSSKTSFQVVTLPA